jgi:hypothetical protein
VDGDEHNRRVCKEDSARVPTAPVVAFPSCVAAFEDYKEVDEVEKLGFWCTNVKIACHKFVD